MAEEFVSLHNHADTSILDGYGKVSEYVEKVAQMGQRGIGLTDHGVTSGIYELMQHAKAHDIIGVPGCEFYVAPENPEGARVREPVFYGTQDQRGQDVSARGRYLHLTVWATSQEGMSNLFKLSTLSNRQENRLSGTPRIDTPMLLEHSDGLVVATGCPSSEVSTRFRLGQDEKAYAYTARLHEVFRDRLYVEVMDHGMSIPLERDLLIKQKELARHFNLPFLATNDAHYAEAEDAPHHEEMLASQSGARMSDPTREEMEAARARGEKVRGRRARFAFDGREYYLKTAHEMARLFPDDEFPHALSNSIAIAEMAQGMSLDYDPSLMPTPPIPEGYTEHEYLWHLLRQGLEERFGTASDEVREKVWAQVEREFKVIASSNFVGYFLTVVEAVTWEKKAHSLVAPDGRVLVESVGPGRGSGAGSMIAYLIGITGVNPMEHDLIFERFMSDGRGDIMEVTYEDGSTERFISSHEHRLSNGETKYTHQLAVGDTVKDEA